MDEGGTCLRCGQPYEPGDTVCYHCGAPIGETQTPTQPVRAVRTVAPEGAGGAGEASVVSSPVVTTAPAAEGAIPPQLATQHSRRPVWPWLTLACVVVIVALGGGAYTLRTLTASPPVPSRTLYQDPGHRFRFERPALWSVAPIDNGVTLSDSSGASTATVALVTPQTGDTATSYADTLAHGPTMQPPLGDAPPRTIGGDLWEQRAGQVTGADGVARQVVVLVTLHAGELYVIRFSSPVASYSADATLVYTPLLDSFAFA
jgi:hypothetical protein